MFPSNFSTNKRFNLEKEDKTLVELEFSFSSKTQIFFLVERWQKTDNNDDCLVKHLLEYQRLSVLIMHE